MSDTGQPGAAGQNVPDARALLESVAGPIVVITGAVAALTVTGVLGRIQRNHALWFATALALVVVGAAIVIAPWAIWTYGYFGKPLYSNLNFYPFTHSWVPMNYATVPPNPAAFIEASGGIIGVAKVYGAIIVRAFDGEGIRIAHLQLHAPSLDDVFLAKTGRSLEGAEDAPEDAAEPEAAAA